MLKEDLINELNKLPPNSEILIDDKIEEYKQLNTDIAFEKVYNTARIPDIDDINPKRRIDKSNCYKIF